MSGGNVQKALGTPSLVLLMLIAVDSVRAYPVNAEYGFSLVTFYLIGALFFMVPVGLVAAELSTAFPEDGGSYIWVREAFGGRWAFWVAWLQWVYNLVWFPTILSFLAETVGQALFPEWVHDKTTLYVVLLMLYYTATLMNWFGLNVSTWITDVFAVVGTLVPTCAIIALGVWWLSSGHVSAVSLDLPSLVPDFGDQQTWAIFGGLLFGLIGLEMPAVYAGQFKDPRKYLHALAIASALIVVTGSLASLSVAIAVPASELHLGSAVVDASKLMLEGAGLGGLSVLIALLIAVGALGGVSAWILAPTQCLAVASQKGDAPQWMGLGVKHGPPRLLLTVQALVFTLLATAFLFFDGFNQAYWLLSAITAELALLYYGALFLAYLRLRKTRAHVPRPFKVGGQAWGPRLVGGAGLLTCAVAWVTSWLIPPQLVTGQHGLYYLWMVVGVGVGVTAPWLFRPGKKP